MVPLKNEGVLPLSKEQKVYFEGMTGDIQIDFGTIVSSPEDADFVILKLETPTLPPEGGRLMESMFPQGRLDFPQDEKAELLDLIKASLS